MSRLHVYASVLAISFVSYAVAQQDKSDESVRAELKQHQYDLLTDGKVFFSDDARGASFFLLGELHGENEIPGPAAGVVAGDVAGTGTP
jgi:hypothetical protein